MANTEELINVDKMLSHVGDFGNYQYVLLLLFSAINLLSGFHYFAQTIISIVPTFKCKITHTETLKLMSSNECSNTMYQNETYFEKSCDAGWDYNTTYGYGFLSIIQDLNWVCDNSWKPALGQSVFFIGSVLGSLMFGILADKIGRLHILIIANLLALIGNICTIFSTNITIFAISRFIAGCATDTNFVMMYIIVMEYIRPSMRTFGLNICIGIFYCLSCMIVSWIAVLLQNWKMFLWAVAIPHISVLLFYFLVPESAQWLISKGRFDEAIHCFKRIAKFNNHIIDQSYIESLERYCKMHIVPSNHESLLGLLKTPRLRRKTLILVFKSMVMTLGYDAISRNINGLEYSPFIIFTAMSFTIFPACLFILAVQDKIGRKALASGSLLVSGIFAICSGIIQLLIDLPSPMLIIALATISRFAINVAYNSGAQYAVELIPTVVRGQGVAAIHVTGYAATFFSPQILYLKTIWKPSPEVILGILLLCGAGACLFLPETLNRTLPVSLQDGEHFGEEEHIFEFASNKSPTESTTELTGNIFPKYL